MSVQLKNRASKKKAFTLIELLVVIAIIALLLSVLMPALGKAKELARRVVCQARLKQVGLAMVLYSEANDGAYLLHEWANDDSYDNYDEDTGGYFYARLAPYIGTEKSMNQREITKFLRCPSGDAVKEFGDEFIFGNRATDYGIQSWAVQDARWERGDVATPKKFDNIKQTQDFAMFFDFFYGNEAEPDVTSGGVWSTKWFDHVDLDRTNINDPPFVEFTKSKILRHSGGIDSVFADGHVEYIKDPSWWDDMASPSSIGWGTRNN